MSMCPWAVFSAYSLRPVLKSCSCTLSLQHSLVLLHSEELRKIRQACFLAVASLRKSDTRLDRVHFSRAAPVCLTCIPSLHPFPHPSDLSYSSNRWSRGPVDSSLLRYALQPWLLPRECAAWIEGAVGKQEVITEQVWSAEGSLQVKVAGVPLIFDISCAACSDYLNNVL